MPSAIYVKSVRTDLAGQHYRGADWFAGDGVSYAGPFLEREARSLARKVGGEQVVVSVPGPEEDLVFVPREEYEALVAGQGCGECAASEPAADEVVPPSAEPDPEAEGPGYHAQMAALRAIPEDAWDWAAEAGTKQLKKEQAAALYAEGVERGLISPEAGGGDAD